MKGTNIKKIYENKVALDIENFEIEEGKITAIIGPNGSGKSTLAKILVGILKNSGNADEFVGSTYMTQKTYPFKMSTLKNVLLTSKEKEKDTPRALKLLEELGLKELAKQNASSLSEGEMQKMSLARILLNPTKVVILDEPTSSMDLISIEKAEALIKRINEESKVTFVLITHSIAQAERLSSNVIFLNKGKIEEIGETKDVLKSPKSEPLKDFIKLER